MRFWVLGFKADLGLSGSAFGICRLGGLGFRGLRFRGSGFVFGFPAHEFPSHPAYTSTCWVPLQ